MVRRLSPDIMGTPHRDPKPTSAPYQIVEEPSGAGRKLRVITIGAGASGLNLQHELDESLPSHLIEHIIYEKNPSIGGTWFENRYPGCACDIPSVNYALTWAPNSEWKSYYSTAPEILDYFKKVSEKYKLARNVRLNHLLVHAEWIESRKKWHVKLQRNGDPNDIVEDEGDVLVNATGVLNKWKWPAISGRETFKGPMLHSAAYDNGVSLKGKRVAVIGSGSSGVQIIPNILPEVSSLITTVRSKTWITAGFAQRFAGPEGRNFEYSEEHREIFRNDPAKYKLYRKTIESELNSRFRFILNGSAEQAEATVFADAEMRKKLSAKPEVADIIVPTDFAPGCRRPTPGNGFLEALCDEKTTVIAGGIQAITETGLVDYTGKHHEVDVIICATGFDVTWRPRYPLIGRHGKNLADEWSHGPSNYLSITVPNFPNYFTFMGPFAPYGHGSVLPLTEHFARHLRQMLEKMMFEHVITWEPTQEAVDDFTEHRKTFLPRCAWTQNCNSWFKQGMPEDDLMMWPGSRLQFFEILAKPRWEDYNVTTLTRNRFSYMANGFHQREFDGRDLSWYLGLLEGGKDAQGHHTDDDIKEFFVVPDHNAPPSTPPVA